MADAGSIRLLITGGGTGGHLFPAVASAQALLRLQPQSEVLFVGTRRKIDTTSLDRYGFRSSSIVSYGLKGKSVIELLKAVGVLPVSLAQAMLTIRKFKPDVALGVGGYVTGPVMLAAKMLGVPTVVHEQNSVPGMANRKLGGIVDRICISLPGSESYFPPEKTVFTGNPVRQSILDLAGSASAHKHGRKTLLVLGGSQGAHRVNRLVVDAFCGEGSMPAGVDIIHQTGSADAEWVREEYRRRGIAAEVAPFFQEMDRVYARADVLVSRAGATTLTELAVLGKPAVLIPYPYAADNHQQKNGEYYVQGGGALQFVESGLTGAKLAAVLQDLLADEEGLERMGRAMKQLGRPDAAEKIAGICLQQAAG